MVFFCTPQLSATNLLPLLVDKCLTEELELDTPHGAAPCLLVCIDVLGAELLRHGALERMMTAIYPCAELPCTVTRHKSGNRDAA